MPIPMLLLLAACATQQQQDINKAVTTPLNDLNLVNAPIPEVLGAAARAPYELPQDQSCPALAAAVRALDEVLGADLDAAPSEANPGLVERSGEALGQAAVSSLQRGAEGIVPFRAWIRRLSGAERYSKQVAAAIAAGSARRGFLRGVAAARGCR